MVIRIEERGGKVIMRTGSVHTSSIAYETGSATLGNRVP